MPALRCLLASLMLIACGRVGFSTERAPSDAAPLDGENLDAGACTHVCIDDYAAMSSTCGAGPITFQLISPGDPHVLRADMTGFTSLEANVEVCDPSGPVFQIADSPTSRTSGGDAGSASNDAHVLLLDTQLVYFRSEYGTGSNVLTGYVAASGCTTRRIVIGDGTVWTAGGAGLDLTEDAALRLDPPIDDEGTPDRLWYLGINRTVHTGFQDEGTGLQRVTFCLR